MLKSEEWDRVFNAIPDPITVHDCAGVITWANELSEGIYGRKPGDMVGLTCDQVFHGKGADCPHNEVLTNEKASWAEKVSVLGDRSYRIFISPMVDGFGQVVGFIRVMRDVTEREKLKSQALWAEKFTTLGQMINGIAHDVGTPLNIISGYAEYLLMRTKPEASGYKELSTILNQTRRIAEFIKQMLDLARPSQGRIDAIGLKGFISESLDLMGHHLRKAQVRASLLCKTDPPVVYGDAPRLRQALFNLLLNASQMVGPEGRLEIELEEESAGKVYTRISIKGYDRLGETVDLSKSFLPFLSADEDSDMTGMGLSLAREILNDFGARFEAMGNTGSGDGLYIYLSRGKQMVGRVMERDAS